MPNRLYKLLASLVLVKVKEMPPETFGGFSFYHPENADQLKNPLDEFSKTVT